MANTSSNDLLNASFQWEPFIHQLPYAVLLVNEAGKIIEVNEILLRVTDYSRRELINQDFQKILPFEGTIGQLCQQEDNKEMVSEKSAIICKQVKWADKAGITRGTTALMIAEQVAEPYYIINLIQLTKEVNHSLTYRFMEQLTTEPSLGVIVIDRQARIVEISQMACRLLGMPRNEVINLHVDEIFNGIPEEQRIVQRSLLDGVKVQNKPTSWMTDQQRYELLVDSNTLHDEKGQVIGGYFFFKDVTNLRSFEQNLERNDRLAMIGQIAAGTAHEIRNPLTSIKGFLQMFLQSFKESGMEREQTYTEIMLTEINRINTLVSEFLLLSKQKDVQYQMVDLNSVFKEILPIVESQALLYGIDVKFSSRPLPMVIGNAELLKQVFLNICKNGIEAMGKDGILTINHHLETESKKISIDIHDTGPGIPMYVVDKIFDPFFTTKEEGTGLGLSICQKIIHDIGGQIRVSSKGYGTTFHIIIPYW